MTQAEIEDYVVGDGQLPKGKTMNEQLLKVFPDKHEIRRDSRQYIFKHPSICPHAKRGNLRGQYAKYTYLTSEYGFQAELAGCHLVYP